ncbi:rod shape-determining protein MreC [Variovorax fucosicus]|uniref:rod shape-determining protein MreC n=1 Tax=Variovorax fucosicus TaxID=3053517 RepID=UPI002574D167|nr:rod shape-determining protein MreC [Variovorax sp. J22G47]MDM0055466.1 rod shape-determining protein MreC [Variovorax sp. J22G47]
MPLGTVDRTAPPLFNQGPSALSKLIFFSALSLFLMVADARFDIVRPVRAAVGAVLYPVQWIALKPVQMALGGTRYFEDLQVAQRNEADARRALALQSERAGQADALAQENTRLRAMLDLRATTDTPGRVAEVLYDAADPYTRKLILDQGMTQGIAAGSPVIDEHGVLGQVTQVQPFTSEVTLVIDRDLSIPVQNGRTGARSVAFGEANAHGGGLELRFMQANSDVQEGDLLTTSGVDGVYPPGLPVAKIDRIERRADSAFARIHCVPLAGVTAARYVMVLSPLSARSAPRPAASAAAPTAAAKKKADKEKAVKDKTDKAEKDKADKADKKGAAAR